MGEPITLYKEEKAVYGAYDPGALKPGIMMVLEDDGTFGDPAGTPKMVDFLCPCGCGHRVPTHLITPADKEGPHRWNFSRGPNGPTLTPSIRWLSGCKAHFNITDGKVIMHADSGK